VCSFVIPNKPIKEINQMNQTTSNSLKAAFVALMTIYSSMTYVSAKGDIPLPPVSEQETTSLMSVSSVSTLSTSVSSTSVTIPASKSTVTVTIEAEDGTIMDVLTYKAGASKVIDIDTAGYDSGTYTVTVSNKSGVIYDTFIFVP
jgi:hypothetical protein